MLSYLFSKLNKITENRKERLNRKGKKAYLALRRRRPTPAQPAQRGTGVFFPSARLQAARWNATELAGHATSSPRSFQPPRGLISHLEAPGDAMISFSPSRASSSSSSVRFLSPPRTPWSTPPIPHSQRHLELKTACPRSSSSSTASLS